MNPINVLATIIYFIVFLMLLVAVCVYLWDTFRKYTQEKKSEKQKDDTYSHL